MMYDVVLMTHLLQGPRSSAQPPHEHYSLPKHCGPACADQQSDLTMTSNDPAAALSLEQHNNHIPVNQGGLSATLQLWSGYEWMKHTHALANCHEIAQQAAVLQHGECQNSKKDSKLRQHAYECQARGFGGGPLAVPASLYQVMRLVSTMNMSFL